MDIGSATGAYAAQMHGLIFNGRGAPLRCSAFCNLGCADPRTVPDAEIDEEGYDSSAFDASVDSAAGDCGNCRRRIYGVATPRRIR